MVKAKGKSFYYKGLKTALSKLSRRIDVFRPVKTLRDIFLLVRVSGMALIKGATSIQKCSFLVQMETQM